MIKKTLKHFGAFGLVLAALFAAPAPTQAQDGYWGHRDYNQQRNWDRHEQRHEWREQRRQERQWRAWERSRDWRRRNWRDDRWSRPYRRGYVPDRSFYFGYRY